MDKTILVFSIIVACVIGVGTGVSLGAIQTGEMYTQFNHMIKGMTNNLSNTPQISTQTHDVQNAISSANIGFDMDTITVDSDNVENSGDEHFLNVVSACEFHSATSIETNTCVVCTLKNEAKESLGTGKVDLAKYDSSSSVSIPITDVQPVGANNVFDVKNVEVKVCEQGNGCSINYWKDHLGRWSDTGYNPGDKFKSVFGINDKNFKVTIEGKNNSDPTLQQALNAEGEGINAISRDSVASLLNSRSNINFSMNEDDVKISTYHAFSTKDYESTHDHFSKANDQDCPYEHDDRDGKGGDGKDGKGGDGKDGKGGDGKDGKGGDGKDGKGGDGKDGKGKGD